MTLTGYRQSQVVTLSALLFGLFVNGFSFLRLPVHPFGLFDSSTVMSMSSDGNGQSTQEVPIGNASRESAAMIPKAPMYITIGPPCVGKTTMLEKLQEKHDVLTDVALDDQLDVYVTVPTRLFLSQNHSSIPKRDKKIWKKRIQNKTIERRLQDQSQAEMKCVLQRLGGVLSASDFQERVETVYRDIHVEQQMRQQSDEILSSVMSSIETNETTKLSRHQQEQQERNLQRQRDVEMVARTLIHAVEQQVQKKDVALPETVELFVVESLFRPHRNTNQTGVERAEAQLWQASGKSDTTALAWGNTNTRPREYKVALEVAEYCRRPVYFIMHANREASQKIENDLFLPQQPLSVLVSRNLDRMLRTGKYVPALSIFDSSSRVENLLNRSLYELERPYLTNKTLQDEGGGSAASTDSDRKQPVEGVEAGGQENKDGGSMTNDTVMTEAVTFTGLDLDKVLCEMINFRINPDRTVCKINTPNQKKRTRSFNRDQQRPLNSATGRFGRNSNCRRPYNANNGPRQGGRSRNNGRGEMRQHGNRNDSNTTRREWTQRGDWDRRQQGDQRSKGGRGSPYNRNNGNQPRRRPQPATNVRGDWGGSSQRETGRDTSAPPTSNDNGGGPRDTEATRDEACQNKGDTTLPRQS